MNRIWSPPRTRIAEPEALANDAFRATLPENLADSGGLNAPRAPTFPVDIDRAH